MTLQKLCKYYISCIELEGNTTLRTSLKDSNSFICLPWINNNALKLPDIGNFLRVNYEKEKELLIGYPILKVKHFLSPVFIVHVTHFDGSSSRPEGFYIDDELLINKDIVDKYSPNEKTENIFELRELEAELGFTDGHATFSDLAEKVSLLQAIRTNWEWKDDMALDNLTKGAVRFAENDGILNRAIILAKDPTPYTVGLMNELARLGSNTDLNIKDSILWKFINNRFNDNKQFEKEIVEVLPLNEEQEKAIKSALSADVTLISGPPGTGKTQVVANLIINAAINNQTVLFTSKNNNAVDVVVKRVNSLNNELPLILRLEKNAIQCITEYTQQWEKAIEKKNHSKTLWTNTSVYIKATIQNKYRNNRLYTTGTNLTNWSNQSVV